MIWQRSPQAGNGCASLGQGRPPWPEGEHLREPGERRARPCEPPLDLPASALAVEAPCAEVLAIVGHDPIAVLSHTRQRPLSRRPADVPRGGRPFHPQNASRGEFRQRRHLHWPAAPGARQPGVMHDLAVPYVDAVVGVAASRRHQPAAQWQLCSGRAVQLDWPLTCRTFCLDLLHSGSESETRASRLDPGNVTFFSLRRARMAAGMRPLGEGCRGMPAAGSVDRQHRRPETARPGCVSGCGDPDRRGVAGRHADRT